MSEVGDLIAELDRAGIKWWATEEGNLACSPEVTDQALRRRIIEGRTDLLVVASIRQSARVAREVYARLDAIEARLGPTREEVRNERAIAKRLRFDVLRRDGFKCSYCGVEGNRSTLQVDHVVPVSKGGKSTLANLTTACEPCNAGKSDKSVGVDAIPARRVARPTVARREGGPPLSAEETARVADEIMAMLNAKDAQ